MTVPDGAVLRCSARFEGYHDQDIVNVFQLRCDFTAAQLEATVFSAVDTYLSSVYEEWDPYLEVTIAPNDLKVDVIEFIGGEWVVTANVGFGSWGSSIVGVDAGQMLPAGVAAVGFLYTDLGKHQGRKFFGGFTETVNSQSGAILSSLSSLITAGLTLLLTPHTISAGNTLVSCIPGTADGVIRDVTSIGVNTHWGYQRRRRPGVGS